MPDSQTIHIPEKFGMFLKIFDRINGLGKNQNTELYNLFKECRTLTALLSTSVKNTRSTAVAVKELIKDDNLYSLKTAEGLPDPTH
jgi:hypothetical protein